MKNKLKWAVVALAALLCALGTATLFCVDVRGGCAQLAALATGLAAAWLMCLVGANRLTASVAFAIAAAVAVLCLTCLLCPPVDGRRTELVLWNCHLLSPGAFVPPAMVLCLAAFRRFHLGSVAIALLAFAATLLVGAMCYPSGIVSSLLLCAVLYGFVVRSRRHLALRWSAAALLGLAPLVLHALVFGSIHGAELLRFKQMALAKAIAETPWLAPHAHNVRYFFFGDIWTGTIEQANFWLGRWTTVAIPVVTALLVICLTLAAREVRDPLKRILAIGGTVNLTLPLLCGVMQFFTSHPDIRCFQTFLSAGGSLTVASFVSLGLVLLGLSDGPTRKRDESAWHVWDGLLGLVVVVALASCAGFMWLGQYLSPPEKIRRETPPPASGRFYACEDGVRKNGFAYVPVRQRAEWGEPCVIVEIAKCRDGQIRGIQTVTNEPPVVEARCRALPDRRIAVDCRDLYGREFTFTFQE